MITRFLDRLAGLIGPGYLNHDAITRLCESGAVKFLSCLSGSDVAGTCCESCRRISELPVRQ